MSPSRLPYLALALCLLPACSDDVADPLPEEVVWSNAETLISTESGLLAGPVDLAVGLDGTLYVLDGRDDLIQRVGPDGEILEPIGGSGSGPGELDGPVSFRVTGDRIRVVDRGNGRLQLLGTTGAYLGSTPLPPQAVRSIAHVGPGGRLLVPTLGRDSVLARLLDPGGEEVAGFGSPLAEVPAVLDFNALRQEIADGEVPGYFRNRTELAFGPEDHVWMALAGEGAVRRYDTGGALLVEVQLDEPEFAEALEEFFRRNQEPTERPSLFALRYIAELRPVGTDLWVLLNGGDDDPGVLLVLGEDGARKRRIELPTVFGASTFTVDPTRGRLYLAIPSLASVVALEMTGSH